MKISLFRNFALMISQKNIVTATNAVNANSTTISLYPNDTFHSITGIVNEISNDNSCIVSTNFYVDTET